ncbi:GFA family protein [Marinomonas epiphytica]
MQTKASCLCGSVTFDIELSSSDLEMAVCHCSMCRKWLGSPMMAIDSGKLKNITGESFVSRYASSEWAQRGFCNKCGTSLFYYLAPAEQYHFPVGLLDESLEFTFSHQIFIDEKPDYYEFKNKTYNMTGEEVFAHFSGESDT